MTVAETAQDTSSRKVSMLGEGSRVREIAALGVLLLVMGIGYAYKLSGVYVPHMDEGTYLYAARLISEGNVPYRDFYLAHPPLLMYIFALPMNLSGNDVMVARAIFIVLVLASMIPLYSITKSLSGVGGGFVAVALYGVGMLLLANSPRAVRLEPFLNIFVICVIWLYFQHWSKTSAQVGAGLLSAAAVMIKLVAALPLGLLVVGDLVFRRPDIKSFFKTWMIVAVACLPILIVILIALGGFKGFVDDVIIAQLDRPGLPLLTRIENFKSACVRFPAIPFSLLAAAWFLVKDQDYRVKVLSLLALGQVALLILGFKSSFNYYYLQVLPVVAILCAIVGHRIATAILPQLATPAMVAGAAVLMVVLPLAYSYAYERQSEHTTEAGAVLAELRQQPGTVYSMYPSFGFASGRPLTNWHYMIDSLLPRANGEIADDEFIKVMSESQSLVLWNGEFQDNPKLRGYLEGNFHTLHKGPYWQLWVK